MRRLDGGTLELSSVIVRSLQASFPGNEFFLDTIDQDSYTIFWRHATGPAEDAVKEFMTRRWGQFTINCAESEGHTFSGPTGGVRGAAPSASAGAPVTTVQGADAAAILKSLLPAKRSTTKACPQCGKQSARSARRCMNCSFCFPECLKCNKVIQLEDWRCTSCGYPRWRFIRTP